jgi:hypothetical protein
MLPATCNGKPSRLVTRRTSGGARSAGSAVIDGRLPLGMDRGGARVWRFWSGNRTLSLFLLNLTKISNGLCCRVHENMDAATCTDQRLA